MPRHLRSAFDLDARQKWAAIWPALSMLPPTPMRLLDAGCGNGMWAFEVARERPDWVIVGIDRDGDRVLEAQRAADSLKLENLRFQQSDFLDYVPTHRFQTVLSVASAHYLAEEGDGVALFRKFAGWLDGDGCLVLYGPRCRSEVPLLRGLPEPFPLRDVFSADQLRDLCAEAGLGVESLSAVTGAPGTVAKQIGRLAGASIPARLAAMPVQWALDTWDRHVATPDTSSRSSAWLLVARAALEIETR